MCSLNSTVSNMQCLLEYAEVPLGKTTQSGSPRLAILLSLGLPAKMKLIHAFSAAALLASLAYGQSIETFGHEHEVDIKHVFVVR